jgi:hypothetical protein
MFTGQVTNFGIDPPSRSFEPYQQKLAVPHCSKASSATCRSSERRDKRNWIKIGLSQKRLGSRYTRRSQLWLWHHHWGHDHAMAPAAAAWAWHMSNTPGSFCFIGAIRKLLRRPTKLYQDRRPDLLLGTPGSGPACGTEGSIGSCGFHNRIVLSTNVSLRNTTTAMLLHAKFRSLKLRAI